MPMQPGKHSNKTRALAVAAQPFPRPASPPRKKGNQNSRGSIRPASLDRCTAQTDTPNERAQWNDATRPTRISRIRALLPLTPGPEEIYHHTTSASRIRAPLPLSVGPEENQPRTKAENLTQGYQSTASLALPPLSFTLGPAIAPEP